MLTYEQINICLTEQARMRYKKPRKAGKLKMSDNEYLRVEDDTVKKVLDEMPPDEMLYDLAELFKVFGDSTRIKILYALFDSELCVNDIATLLGITQTAASHQLRVLKVNKLVKSRKEGKMIFYSLSDEHVTKIISQGMEHIEE